MRNHLRRSTFLTAAALMAATLLASDPMTGSASALTTGWRADTGAPSDASNLFLLFTLAIMAIPVLLTMTLLATVLTRR